MSPDVQLCEDAVALQIDDLLGLQDRKGNRVIPVLMRVGPNEPVLFRAVGEVLLDDPRGLILPLRSVRGRPDAVALVFDRRRVRLVRLAGRSPAGHAGPCGFEFRKHGPRPSLGATEITMPALRGWYRANFFGARACGPSIKAIRRAVAAMIESISAITLATHDMSQAVRFYRMLGFEIIHGGEDAAFTGFRVGTSYLNLIAQPAERKWYWWGRVIFYCSDVDALHAR